MTDTKYESLIGAASRYLQQQQAQVWATFNIDSYEYYHYDQETGKLVFSNFGIPQVVTDFQVVGSVSTASNTWRWAWANESILPGVRYAAEIARAFGEREQIVELSNPSWSADAVDGWTMTALTAYLTGAKAGYRCLYDQGFLYVVLTQIDRVVAPPSS